MLVASCILRCVVLCLTVSTSLGNNQGNKCPKGQYESDFLSGGCTPCPKLLKQCDYQQTEDVYRCRLACRRILSTAAPISNPTSVSPHKSTYSSHTVTTTTARVGTKRFFEKITKLFNNTLLFPRKDYFPIRPTKLDRDYKHSGQQNWTEITVGILISAVALIILVAAICLAVYWKKCSTAGSNSDQRRRSGLYAQVSPQSRSNSDQSINNTGERLENTDEEAANSENSNGNLSSVSHEDFEAMAESQV